MISTHKNMDNIPKYIYNRDVIGQSVLTEDMIELKKKVMNSNHVQTVLDEQWDDGSWGRFHSMNTSSKDPYTTEKALRRLLHLGLDKTDEPIIKAVNYMESYLKGEIELRDYREKKHDWTLLTHLFVATWLLRIDNKNALALEVAYKWAQVIEHAFEGDSFNQEAYYTAYDTILKPEKNKSYWFIENFYVVSILKGKLSSKTEKLFIDHLLNHPKGIYYIYSDYLNTPPEIFKSREANRYLEAIELIADFEYKEVLGFILPWLEENKTADDLWDMSKVVKDSMVFPLSDSWRKEINRKMDTTVRILKLIAKIGRK
ncbi:MAG: hypothetical protein JEZ08_10945 [Clostridiales bacterium]|nr:hypothetical protein [Clostridiales bacterium]